MVIADSRGSFEAGTWVIWGWCGPRIVGEGCQILRVLIQDGDGKKAIQYKRLLLSQLKDIIAPKFLDVLSAYR